MVRTLQNGRPRTRKNRRASRRPNPRRQGEHRRTPAHRREIQHRLHPHHDPHARRPRSESHFRRSPRAGYPRFRGADSVEFQRVRKAFIFESMEYSLSDLLDFIETEQAVALYLSEGLPPIVAIPTRASDAELPSA